MPAEPLSHDPSPHPDVADLWQPLRAVVGDSHVLAGDDAAGYTVEGIAPRAVVRPGSMEELSEVMAFAHRHRLITVPWGSGSQMHVGNPMTRVDIVCSMERLNQLVEYEPADMTLAVQAGMPLADLQAQLAEKGQFLPLDPPVAPTATMGGCLSTRASGPLRAGFGTLRDRLLGVRAVLPDGRIAKAGGRVVKNVAGYDLGRLYTGALGTLVVVVDIFLKVQPLPAAWGALCRALPDAAAAEAAIAAVMDSEVNPAALELINPALSARLGWSSHWHLAVGFAGTRAEVDYVTEQADRLIASAGGRPTSPPAAGAEASGDASTADPELSGGASTGSSAAGSPSDNGQAMSDDWRALHPLLVEAHRTLPRPRAVAPELGAGDQAEAGPEVATAGPELLTDVTTARAHLLSSQVTDFMESAGDDGRARGIDVFAIAHAFNGIVRLHSPADQTDDAAGLLARWRERAESMGGALVVERAPALVKASVDVWGSPRETLPLMQGVKNKFDPHGILNPGRFL